MPPGMTGYEEALDFDIPDTQGFSVTQKLLVVGNRYLRQFVEAIDHPPTHFPGQIAVLDLTDIQLRLPKQSRTVRFHGADVIRVLVGDENVADQARVYTKPTHLLLQSVVIVARVDHDRSITLAVKEDICHPFPHAGDVFIDPTGVQRLEDLLSTVHFAHFFFLKFRCFLRHMHSSYSALRQRNHAILFRFPTQTSVYTRSSRVLRLKTVS